MIRKWYVTLRHPKMHPHTKFGIPTSKNIGDIDTLGTVRDGQIDTSDRQCDYYLPPKVPLGHKVKVIVTQSDTLHRTDRQYDR